MQTELTIVIVAGDRLVAVGFAVDAAMAEAAFSSISSAAIRLSMCLFMGSSLCSLCAGKKPALFLDGISIQGVPKSKLKKLLRTAKWLQKKTAVCEQDSASHTAVFDCVYFLRSVTVKQI